MTCSSALGSYRGSIA